MADVVRRATFVLDFASGDAKINQADLDPVARSLKEVLDLQKQTVKAIEDQNKATEQLGKKQAEATTNVRSTFLGIAQGAQSAAEGMLLLTRAMVLFGATKEDIAAVAVQLAKVQGVVDLMQGSIKLVEGLTTAFKFLSLAMGPVNAGYTLAIAAVTSITLLYFALTEEVDENTKAIEANSLAQQKNNELKSIGADNIAIRRNQRELAGVSDADNAIITARETLEFREDFARDFGAGETFDNQRREERAVSDAGVALRRAIIGKAQGEVDVADAALRKANAEDEAVGGGDFWRTTPAEAAAEAELDAARKRLELTAITVLDLAKSIDENLNVIRDVVEKQENGAITLPTGSLLFVP